jgi:pyruvate,orthophosphate dikinase
MLDPNAKTTVLARGLPASPGAAAGKVVFSADEAEALAVRGEAVILVRIETSPEDIHGMHAARGVLTTRGGMTSHAAVVARGMGRPCVAGAGDLRIDYEAGTMAARTTLVKAGEIITIDGSVGEVMLGEVPTIQPELSGDFATLMSWADATRLLKVRANAETAIDARTARRFGAEGIGLSRTEHMFFEADRIGAMRRLIMAEDESGRRAALAELLPIQRQDFAQIFRIMRGLPVTIRLLDPPLHEFLPKTEAEFVEMARLTSRDVAAIRHRTLALHETNPMLGHRGCRLGITYPEIYEMQATAIFEAAVAVVKETGDAVEPEIMVPLIATKKEFDILKEMIDGVGKEVMEREATTVPYLVGTMIELPRAALLAGEIAKTAEFFSFGTNDLTQTVFGLSRDDAARFVGAYQRLGIFEHDPFVTLDVSGVGELVRIAAERGRATRPKLKLGICGEHGGDPASIKFCGEVGLDYVSCSPYRVPIARLAAAQAALSGQSGSGTA